MTEEQEVIASMLCALLDIYNGFPIRELNEPIAETINRALNALPANVRKEFEVPRELES